MGGQIGVGDGIGQGAMFWAEVPLPAVVKTIPPRPLLPMPAAEAWPVAEEADRPLRLRFALSGAAGAGANATRTRLFAFWVSTNATTGASRGFVAAGGRGWDQSRDLRGLGAFVTPL